MESLDDGLLMNEVTLNVKNVLGVLLEMMKQDEQNSRRCDVVWIGTLIERENRGLVITLLELVWISKNHIFVSLRLVFRPLV